MHQKNNNAMMNYKNIFLYIIDNIEMLNQVDLTLFDCIYSPGISINVNKYPKIKFIFGPHFSVFPEKQHMDIITGNKIIYIQPSNWVRDIWKYNKLCQNIKVVTLPFGVDTNKFNEIKPLEERNQVFLYYKRRTPSELEVVLNFLKIKGIQPKIFNYELKYNEEDFLNCLNNSKFGIWIDAHESQGFALQEALSCNIPLLVWNVTSMSQEFNSSYSNISATTIPYWDERCGEYFNNEDDLEITFNCFINKINLYKPREYILENLTFDICEQKLIDIIQNL